VVDDGALIPGSPAKAEVRIAGWTAERREILVTGREPVLLAVRLLNYPAWRVAVNGSLVTPRIAEGTAQIVVPIATSPARVTIELVRTADRKLGIGVSSSAGLLLMAMVYLGRRRAAPTDS